MTFYVSKKTIAIIAVLVILIACFAYRDEIATIFAGWQKNIVIAVLSLFIAGCVLGVTIWQGLQNLKHNRISVLPLLICEEELGKDSTIFRLVNSGVGPAIITKIELLFDGKVVSCNDHESYRAFLKEEMEQPVEPAVGYIYAGEIMSVGYKQWMWGLRHGKTKKDIKFIRKLSLRVEYESVYHDKTYVFDSRNDFKTYDVKSK